MDGREKINSKPKLFHRHDDKSYKTTSSSFLWFCPEAEGEEVNGLCEQLGDNTSGGGCQEEILHEAGCKWSDLCPPGAQLHEGPYLLPYVKVPVTPVFLLRLIATSKKDTNIHAGQVRRV